MHQDLHVFFVPLQRVKTFTYFLGASYFFLQYLVGIYRKMGGKFTFLVLPIFETMGI